MTESDEITPRETAPPVVTVLAVAGDDTWLHLYRDVPSMLKDDDIGTKGNFHGPIEFFDRDAFRLVPVFGPDWQLEDLRKSHEMLDPCLIRRRLYAVVRHVEGHLRRHPEVLEPYHLTLEDAISQLPPLTGPDLDDDLAVLWTILGPFSHSGGFFHNALHAAGWRHD